MKLRTLDQADLNNKTVIVRADFNVPMNGSEITDTTRIDTVKPTIDYLKEKNCKIILASHFGRPKDEPNPEFSLKQIVDTVAKIFENEITLNETYDYEEIHHELTQGKIVLLENLRFHAGEQSNDPTFAKKLADLADIYVNDAFGVSHRDHASVTGITKFLPSYAGKLTEREVNALSEIREGNTVQHPLTVIVGGAKIDTKIGVLKKFTQKADNILVGGALANTFMLAAGYDIGSSLVEADKTDIAREIMLLADKHHEHLMTPKDVIVADEISENTQTLDLPIEDIEGQMKILDIGSLTIEAYKNIIAKSATIIWNGPMGLYEFSPFARGTKEITEAIANSNAKSYVGGGDSVDAINKFNIPYEKFTHVSTGGGAMIDFLKGLELPAIELLRIDN